MTVLLPIKEGNVLWKNHQPLVNIPALVLGNIDVPFYSNNQMLMQKGILND
jgi:ATP-dependent Lon protease